MLARDLLRDHPEARTATAARYRCLLVDEFQDTDPLQIELAVLLATSDPDRAARRWSDAPIRPGALTLVGDPKQAIYRFRNANLRVYDEARQRLGLEPVALVENFRSTPRILDAVNTVFEEVADRARRRAGRPCCAASPPRRAASRSRVAVVGTAHDEPIVRVREEEAADVAAVVRQIVDEGWLVEDDDGTVRPAVERDVALLIPSRTVLPALEAAFEGAGVPVRVESQSLVYSTAEVRDLLNVLAAIDDATDEIAVVARSAPPASGAATPSWPPTPRPVAGHYRRRPPPSSPSPVVDGLASLEGFWRERWWRTVSGTVDAVVRDRRLLELAAWHRRPRDHWRRIRFVLDEARAWEDAGETSLRGFVEWARRQADEGARVNEAVAPEPDDPALRILTVHGAKGLEFPIVVLAGLNTLPSNQPPPVLWGADGPELRVGTASSDRLVQTPGYEACRADEREHEQAERLRLLYVAMTRARDHLVVSLHHQVPRQSATVCHAARLAPRLAIADLEVLVPDRAARPRPGPPGPEPVSAAPEARDAWIADREALLARMGAPASVAATSLADLDSTGAGDGADAAGETRPPWQRGRAGTAFGRAVHAVLQTVDLVTGAGLEVTARAQALAEGVPDREGEVRALAASVLASPIVRRAAAGGWPCWRELPVGAVIDGVLLEGFVDLLVRSPDGLIVVDYKTDRAPTGPELDATVARYRLQGAAYAAALQEILGEAVVGCVFVFARQPTALERPVPDLPGAVRDVRDRLRSAPAPPERPVPGHRTAASRSVRRPATGLGRGRGHRFGTWVVGLVVRFEGVDAPRRAAPGRRRCAGLRVSFGVSHRGGGEDCGRGVLLNGLFATALAVVAVWVELTASTTWPPTGSPGSRSWAWPLPRTGSASSAAGGRWVPGTRRARRPCGDGPGAARGREAEGLAGEGTVGGVAVDVHHDAAVVVVVPALGTDAGADDWPSTCRGRTGSRRPTRNRPSPRSRWRPAPGNPHSTPRSPGRPSPTPRLSTRRRRSPRCGAACPSR